MINPAKSLNVVWPGFSWFRPDRGLQIVVTIIDTIRSDTYKQVMKVATVREFRDKATAYFKDDEPILVTRHGKVTGLYLPIDHPDGLPIELRKELLVRFGNAISRSLKAKGITEEKLISDFNAFKKARRRR